MSMWPVASDICTPEPGSSTQRAARSGLGDRLLTPGAPQTREKSHAAFLADEEEIAPLEEFERDVGERLRLLGADGATCIINDREVAVGQQRAIAIAGIGLVLGPGEHARPTVHERSWEPFAVGDCDDCLARARAAHIPAKPPIATR